MHLHMQWQSCLFRDGWGATFDVGEAQPKQQVLWCYDSPYLGLMTPQWCIQLTLSCFNHLHQQTCN